jgi:hypothetical protein
LLLKITKQPFPPSETDADFAFDQSCKVKEKPEDWDSKNIIEEEPEASRYQGGW